MDDFLKRPEFQELVKVAEALATQIAYKHLGIKDMDDGPMKSMIVDIMFTCVTVGYKTHKELQEKGLV